MAQSKELKKSLTNLQHMRVLEIIGLSPTPLSAYEIHKQRKSDNKYIYEIVKELAGFDDLTQHSARFLKISYKQSLKEKIRNIEANEKDIWRRDLKIAEISKPRDWRYSLKFKAFLLYLIAVHDNKKVSYRTIDSMIKNLFNYPDFEFLQYVDVFARNHKVDLLIEIAVELQFQLKRLTPEYLKYYIINRCNDEIGISLAVKDYPLYRLYKTQDTDKITSELCDYKLRVLNELILIEEDRLRRRKKERKDLGTLKNKT